jgi:hypothetical protein
VRVIDCRERAVVELWRKGHLSLGTIVTSALTRIGPVALD